MPITRKQFDLGIDDETEGLMGQIYDFLEGHREAAFNREEISKEIGVKDISYGRFNSALSALQRIGAIQSAYAGMDSYYAFTEEVDKTTWERKVHTI